MWEMYVGPTRNWDIVFHSYYITAHARQQQTLQLFQSLPAVGTLLATLTDMYPIVFFICISLISIVGLTIFTDCSRIFLCSSFTHFQ